MLAEDDLAQFIARPADTLDALDRIDCEESLLAFTRRMWPVLEPGRTMVEGWPLEAICEHLEAVTAGNIQKILINVPPGFMKSLETDVFWPAWEWGPQQMPSMRYVAFSYSADLTQRDNRRFRDLLLSHDYGRLFGRHEGSNRDSFALEKTGETLVSNDRTGWKLATSVGGVGTGERGDRVILDDPHNVKESESDATREETIRWFRESMSSRLNDPARSAVVVIMQRVHEEDVSGLILSELGHEYEHLMIPMEWEGSRRISTVPDMTWSEDPRTKLNELAWSARFPAKETRNLKIALGPYATAGQLQQRPTPRGGGIFKRDWWQLWDPPPDANGFQRLPQCEFKLASLDGAFGEKQENDYHALTIWGLFRHAPGVLPASMRQQRPYLEQTAAIRPGMPDAVAPSPRSFVQPPKLILMHAWQKRLPLHGPEVERMQDETDEHYRRRSMPEWGVVEWVVDSCKRYGVNLLLIEAKANGFDVASEIRRQHKGEGWGVRLIDPGRLDKVARAYSVQPILADAMVYAPDREWADEVISQMSVFPKTAHDDLTDSATQAWKWLRDAGLLMHAHELDREMMEQLKHQPESKPLYPT